jgi:signal transduction histidine kinase
LSRLLLRGHNRLMTLRSRAFLAWSLFGLCLLLLAASAILEVASGHVSDETAWGSELGGALLVFGSLVFPAVGAVLASRRAGGAIGWICLAVGLAVGFVAVTGSAAKYALVAHPGQVPGGHYLAWASAWTWMIFIGLIAIYLVLLFPTGAPPSPRWRPVAWIAGIAIAVGSIGMAFAPGRLEDAPVKLDNPVGIEGAKTPLAVLATAGFLGFAACVLAAVASMVVRFRHSRGTERQQLKWFASATLFTTVVFFLGVLATPLVPSAVSTALQSASLVAFLTLPVAAGIAILKYRLYDLDLVLNKTVVYAALAVFITALYVGIVVGIGALLGAAGNVYLSILATAIVALAFQPARARAQRLANRLVYGKRASPYEVLAEFADQVARSMAAEEILPRMAHTVADATGARTSEVWLRSGSQLRLAAAWPGPANGSMLALANGHLPPFPDAVRAVEVRHHDELLGALAITKAPGESLAPIEEKLLNDVASQAGLVLRNARLTSELLARLDELQASRQRLVTAQDEERRRLERNLHDGAQQHLVALKVNLGLVARQAGAGSPLASTLVALQAATDEAIEALRDLARGIYPPLLADRGLAAALEAQGRKSPVAVEIRDEGVARYPQDIEAAVYFCALEALQNVAKFAHARSATVTLAEEDGSLRFSVLDDGDGFDPALAGRGAGLQNMGDRVEALGGALDIVSAPGSGTTVSGSIPVATAVEPVLSA